MQRRYTAQTLALVPLLLSLLGCGGSGAGTIASVPVLAVAPPIPAPSPAPSPPPGPAPSTPAFVPTAATIFPEPLYNPQLTVVGQGFQFDYVSDGRGGTSNLRNADDLSIAYDPATGSYTIQTPIAGSGTIMRTSEGQPFFWSTSSSVPGFLADPSNKNPTNYCCNALSISAADTPQSPYRYVSFVGLYAPAQLSSSLDTIAYGVFAISQPTRAGEVPTTGTARYSGDLFGHFAGDAGATWLEGTARFDFDFAQARLSGELRAGIRCMMGCNYGEDVAYTFADTRFASGATTFSGQLTTPGAPTLGNFAGLFAGPGAIELASEFRMPFFNPEYQRWIDATGAIAARRD